MSIINPKMACLGRSVVAPTEKHSRPNRTIRRTNSTSRPNSSIWREYHLRSLMEMLNDIHGLVRRI